MQNDPETPARSIGRAVLLTVLGFALVAPVALWAGVPATMPGWFGGRIAGVPVLTLVLLGLMAGLMAVALVCLTWLESGDS